MAKSDPNLSFNVMVAVLDQEDGLGRHLRGVAAAAGRRGRVTAVDLGSRDNSLAVLRLLRRRWSVLGVVSGEGSAPAWGDVVSDGRGLLLVPVGSARRAVDEAVKAVRAGDDVAVRGGVVACSADAARRLAAELSDAPAEPAPFVLRCAKRQGLHVSHPPPQPSLGELFLSPMRTLGSLVRATLPV